MCKACRGYGYIMMYKAPIVVREYCKCEVGQKIKKGQPIMIVEAMKTMNHVPSTQDGIVSEVLAKDGEPVEFGQPLISVK